MKKNVKNLITWSPSHLITSKRQAFTLAEVLITLAIIGVVAAMTIPTLMTSYKEKATVSHLWKVYTTLSQALQMAETEHGPVATWGLNSTDTGQVDEEGNKIYDHTGRNLVAKRLIPYLRISKICETGDLCADKRQCYLDGTCSEFKPIEAASSGSDFYLNDGTLISMGWTSVLNNFDIWVMLPTKDKDAYLGKSIFYFHYEDGLLRPDGWNGAPGNNTFENRCNVGTTQNGRGCTAWVIYNKNMDYLHCREKLGWDKAKSCKE